jgi:hypothetical protein
MKRSILIAILVCLIFALIGCVPKLIDSKSAGRYIGDRTTVQIDHAHCSYQQTVDNTPTFCNDAPYPNHTFTLVLWDYDASKFDGKCLQIRGTITSYKNKPQITFPNITGLSFIEICP